MEAKVEKNFKSIEAFVKECSKNNDMCLVIYSPEDDERCNVAFTGDVRMLAQVLHEAIFSRACSEEPDKPSLSLSNSFLNAIRYTLSDEDEGVVNKFTDSLLQVVWLARKIRHERKSKNEDEHDEKCGFDVDDENCQKCKSFEDCAVKELKRMILSLLED